VPVQFVSSRRSGFTTGRVAFNTNHRSSCQLGRVELWRIEQACALADPRSQEHTRQIRYKSGTSV
jgi:hypothetical protein